MSLTLPTFQVAKLLLDKKSQVNVESESNKDSPLTFACWKGHEGVSVFLGRPRTGRVHSSRFPVFG